MRFHNSLLHYTLGARYLSKNTVTDDCNKFMRGMERYTKCCTVALAAENHEMDREMCVIFATDVCSKLLCCVK
jgi:hypothetical protein